MAMPPSFQDLTSKLPDLARLKIERGARARRRFQLKGLSLRSFLAGIVALAALAGWLWHSYNQYRIDTAVVSVIYPSQALTLLTATGYVVPQRKASVASKATGRLEWLGVQEGSEVRAGEVIARLENRDTEAMRDQAAANVLLAEANLRQGQAELAEAEQAFKRSEMLSDKKLVSDSAHDAAVARRSKARAAVAGLEASVAVARANLRIAEVSLDQTLIRAPFDGIVITRNANLGDTITPFSQAVDTKGAVVTIADVNTLEVEADVGESFLHLIRIGQPVEIQLEALPQMRYEGEVSRMVPIVDRTKASSVVKIRFLNRDPKMLSDMSARVAFLERALTPSERKAVLSLPKSAIKYSEDKTYVFVVDDGRVRLQPITISGKIGELVEITGIEAGTRVVVRPPSGLQNGQSITEVFK